MAHSNKLNEITGGDGRGLVPGAVAKRLPPAAVAVLSIAVAAQAAAVSWHLWSLLRVPASARPANGTRVAGARPAARKIEDLVSAHLFGRSAEREAQPPAAAPDRWILSGTLQGETPESGAAILGDTVTNTHYCAAGHEIGGGFRLAQVFADYVTLERAGMRFSVRLPRSLPSGMGARRIRLAAAVVPEPQPEPAGIHERPANQPQAALELDPSLHKGRGHGHFDGMTVFGIGSGGNLAPYGLRRLDIIRAVDGKPINNSEAQRLALDVLSQGRPVPVTVERNGTVFNLQLAFSEPND